MNKKELQTRWNNLSLPNDWLLLPSPFGLIEGRQDFRGVTWNQQECAEPNKEMKRSLIRDVDLSWSTLTGIKSEEAEVQNVYAEHLTLINCSLRKIAISDSVFSDCRNKSDFLFTLAHGALTRCKFIKCSYSDIFTDVHTVDECIFEEMQLNGCTFLNPKENLLITNSKFSGSWKNADFGPSTRGVQFSGCDLSRMKLSGSSLGDIDVSSIKLPKRESLLTATDWVNNEDNLIKVARKTMDSFETGTSKYIVASMLVDEIEAAREERARWQYPSQSNARVVDAAVFLLERKNKTNYEDFRDMLSQAGIEIPAFNRLTDQQGV